MTTTTAAPTTTTKAYVIDKAGAEPTLQTITLAALGPDEVEIDMRYCGLCLTDCHMQNNDWGISTYPMVAGHEGTGVVSKVGTRVTDLKVGDAVGIGWIRNSCKQCDACLGGKDNLCGAYYQGTYLGENAGSWGRGGCELQGCFAKVMHIDARFAFKLPAGFALDAGAPLLCAGITVWEPIVDYVKPGTQLGVVSLGGLGHMAVKLGAAVGAEVTVLSSSANKAKQSAELGAHHFVQYTCQGELEACAAKLDVIIDTCPANVGLDAILGCLKFGGTYVRVGIPHKEAQTVSIGLIPLIFTGKKIAGSIVSGPANTNAMLRLAASHNIACDVKVVPFTELASTMDALAKGETEGHFRYVMKWD
ncbi:hypothetical protein ACHAW5_004325 [Stephanodiscus triporus]|uniref:Enoyl reductase (ER) domain-containing protein n=1 Tax=Stephanodiscus triporus TaxID=2934178 RepID=A0ABD3N7H5_9STRA